MATLAELRGSRELLVNLTQREVRGKYKRTALGQGWSLLNPLAQTLVFTVVFSQFLRIQPDVGDPSGLRVFALFLLCGLLPWAFFANVLNGGMVSLLANGNLVKKVYFPREVLVAATAFSFNVSFAVELVVLTAAVLAFGAPQVLLFLPLAVPYVVLLTMFGLGFALALSVVNVYFRDTAQFVAIATQVWFYLTPIIYPPSIVPDDLDLAGVAVKPLLELNPMARFVECFRNLFYDNRLPGLADTAYVTVAAVVSLALGYAVFRRFEGRLAEEL
jgi:ABC-2 type transport system permease protein